MIVPSARWQHAFTVAILAVPLLVVVVLSAPAWLLWPFLATDRRTAVLQFVDRLVEWARVLAGVRPTS